MNKKIPLRRCIACRNHHEKSDLIRIVRTPNGELVIDERGKINGRGAYLCKNAECIKKARKKNMLKHALDTEVLDEFYEEILRHVEE